ncbi:MAG: right-handed parallel beta-helix repeat-containing protein, partial [bacterium]|nr:right-handed parallel beta-helix repeat-containing protein [bacterium]
MRRILLLVSILHGIASCSVYYVDSSNGNDAAAGRTPSEAWKTLSRVNDAELLPGDSVLFRRGDVFRGQLIPVSGSEAGDVIYGAYGAGRKPRLLGSVDRSADSDWMPESPGIWVTTKGRAEAVGPELLPNPDFDSGLSRWVLWNNTASGASSSLSRVTASGDFYTAPGGGKVECGAAGQSLSDIQLYTASLSVVRGKWYRLSFMARASAAFTLPPGHLRLMKNVPPYTDYSSFSSNAIELATSWTGSEVLFESTATAADARIDFFLGGVMPSGAILYLDSLTLRELDGNPGVIPCDAGNIIFDEGASCGVKVMEESDLDAQGEFWYDPVNTALKLYSPVHPASVHADIECALTRHIIRQGRKSHVTYEALDVRYGGAHGIGGSETHHITVKDCDFSWIGGGLLEDHVRYGNGVEFWASAADNTVERCTFDQIYDAACTVQGSGDPYEAHDIRFRNNMIRNSEYSFELWAEPAGTWLHDIHFENNTCLNAGSGWGHGQRPDPNGSHLMLWGNTNERMDRVRIRNNIFS